MIEGDPTSTPPLPSAANIHPLESPTGAPSGLRQRAQRASDGIALGCFVVYAVVAYGAILLHFGKDQWFGRTDWAFMLEELIPNAFSHFENHWMTLPILLNRAYFRWFGATYAPHLITLSGLHIALVCLIRVTLRRAAVGPWMATSVASILPLFGPAWVSIVYAPQMGQNLSLVLGLTHALLADQEGPTNRKDWLGLVAGLLGLMSSGIGVFATACVGIFVLARRNVRAALFHTVPLAVIYLAWFSWAHPTTWGGNDPFRDSNFTLAADVRFVWDGIWGTLMALGHFLPVAITLGVILVLGTLVDVRSAIRTDQKPQYLPLTLLGIMPLYLGLVGYQRSYAGPEYATASHHLYTVAYFTLPALGRAAQAIGERLPRFAPAIALLFLGPIPFHLSAFDQSSNTNVFMNMEYLKRNGDRLFAVAHSPYASQALHVNRAALAMDAWAGGLTVGWAIDQAKLGRIPDPGLVDPVLDDSLQLFFGITQLDAQQPGTNCERRKQPMELRPKQGELIRTGTPVSVLNVRRGMPLAHPLEFGSPGAPDQGQVLRIELANMVLRLAPHSGMKAYSYCAARPEANPD